MSNNKSEHAKLNFSDCMGLAIGQIIGSGVMVLTGIVIGLTGHGTPYAYILGALLAIATCIPFIILTSTIPASGAGYTYVKRLLGDKAGFMYIGMVVQAVAGLFNPQTAAETVSQSTSVVGIAVMSKNAIEAGLTDALFFTSMLSVSLGVMNMLPIPPLDGGKFVIEVYQRIRRKMMSLRAVNYLSWAGVALFTLFFIVMMNQDIQRFVFGNW